MKILYLVSRSDIISGIYHHLINNNHKVDIKDNKIEENFDFSIYDCVISFGYRYIIKNVEEISKKYNIWFVNLHISYLPFNRGAHPNYHAHLNNTQHGVTIHLMDDGIDTGPILVQKKIKFEPYEDTLKTTYERLIYEITQLFIKNCDDILYKNIKSFKQCSIPNDKPHKKNECNITDWNIKTSLIRGEYLINEIEKTRSNNNINWMDLLRIAYKNDKKSTIKILKKINDDDKLIGNLLERLTEV